MSTMYVILLGTVARRDVKKDYVSTFETSMSYIRIVPVFLG